MVLLPAPLDPTTAVIVLRLRWSVIPFRIDASGRRGYAKKTSVNPKNVDVSKIKNWWMERG
jgi:hypothetical protein